MDIKPPSRRVRQKSTPPPLPPPELAPETSEVASSPVSNEETTTSTPRKRRRWYRRVGWWWLVIVLVLVALVGCGVWYTQAHVKSVAVKVNSGALPKATPKPTTVADPLTGLQVSPSQASEPIIGVMIENLDPDARPQSGLGQAGVVYEALTEGGITRFLAIFQEPLPSVIGPVRSLRPYFLDWGLEYGIPVAHAGGSQPALAEVVPLGLEDINALEYDGSYFYRITSRAAPHNLYTNAALLTKLDTVLGFAKAPSFTPVPRKADTPPTSVAPHPIIDIDFSYSDYNVEYRYQTATDSYARWMAGTPHVDANTGQQIMVKNVIVEYVPTSYATQPDGDPETIMNLVGSGKAVVFEDGNATQATWSKASNSAQTILTDSQGQQIKLNAGNTWYEIVPVGNTVTY